MGIVSWIKDKYYESRFQKAKRFFSEGAVNECIEILKEILDKHQDASSKLLSIYHTQIENGDKAKIKEATQLYCSYPALRNDCVRFANTISHKQKPVIAIEYIQSIYCAGIREVKTLFINTARQFVLSDVTVNTLTSLTRDTTLVSSLAERLFIDVNHFYNDRDLSRCRRICELILPILTTKEFYKLYSNIRFDSLVLNRIDAISIEELDKLFRDIKVKYNLAITEIKYLTDKGLKVAQQSFNNNDYVASLLVSQRLLDKYSEARKLYADSALKLYQDKDPNKSLIIEACLYRALGENTEDLRVGLETFISYDPRFKQKYIDSALAEIMRLLPQNRYEAELLFYHTWYFTPDQRLLECILSSDNESDNIVVATHILEKDTEILCNNRYLLTFVTKLRGLTNLDYVATSFESLLARGRGIEASYEWVILELAKKMPINSRRRIEILNRGLQHVQLQIFFDTKSKYLKDYITDGQYDKAYAHAEVTTLKGKSGLADVLIAHILLDEAKKSQKVSVKEQKLREAISIRTSHDKLFDEISFDALIPEIVSQIKQLVKNIYGQEKDRANALLYLLRDNGLPWYDEYASLFLSSILDSEPTAELASEILGIIGEGGEAQILSNLWDRYLTIQKSVANKLNANERILYLMSVNHELDSKCNTSNKTDLLKVVNTKICSLLMTRAKNAERRREYESAISDYYKIFLLLGNHKDCQTRIYICKLKSGSHILDEDIKEINVLLKSKNDSKYQKDLAYRWCIYLISNNDLNTADEINKKILDCDPEITQICQEEKIKSQQKILDKINKQINKLNNSSLTAKEAVSFGKTISKTIEDISFIAKITPQKIKMLKESIRVLAIEKFYEEGDYLNSMNGLKEQDSTYLSDPISLRNIAIMALLAVESGNITETNYRELLSIWVTAIYQQRLFVDSLDYTTWDDPYTFSLNDALGRLYNKDEDLPDNVNYAYPDDPSIISILEVQKNLLIRMETAIKEKTEYQVFLNAQVEAMNKLAFQNLDEECVIVAPYLLNLSDSYKENVFSSLRNEASQNYDNWEEILEIGCMYGLKDGDFAHFERASEYLKEALTSISRRIQINKAFTSIKITEIKKFSGLMTQLTSSVMTAINADISQEIEYMNLYNTYGHVVKVIEDDSVAFTFSNYINQQIVRNLNAKNISLAAGARILFDTYSYCKCNPHLKRNLDNIIEALIHNYISSEEDDNVIILDNILSSTREFDHCVVKALQGGDEVPEEVMIIFYSSNENRFILLKNRIGSKSLEIRNQFSSTSKKIDEMKVQLELSQIVDKVNEGTMKKFDALQKVYSIYENNKTNGRVCENLAILIPMCVMEYIIPGENGQQTVEYILDELKSNMSPTYKAHASSVREAYDMIWDSLSMENKIALQGSSIYGLNENGFRLKKGLDYLRTLK